MSTLGNRILQARRFAGLSQTELSLYVHVARSAVAQWEKRKNAITPTVKHLIDIAIATDTSLEWLATGRAQMQIHRPNLLTEIDKPLNKDHQVQNTMEQRSLDALRALPTREVQAIVEMIESLAAERVTIKKKRIATKA
jgi:transcriptional regulator with XRE-family HTH domain